MCFDAEKAACHGGGHASRMVVEQSAGSRLGLFDVDIADLVGTQTAGNLLWIFEQDAVLRVEDVKSVGVAEVPFEVRYLVVDVRSVGGAHKLGAPTVLDSSRGDPESC